jgi:hypothetical protein
VESGMKAGDSHFRAVGTSLSKLQGRKCPSSLRGFLEAVDYNVTD